MDVKPPLNFIVKASGMLELKQSKGRVLLWVNRLSRTFRSWVGNDISEFNWVVVFEGVGVSVALFYVLIGSLLSQSKNRVHHDYKGGLPWTHLI